MTITVTNVSNTQTFGAWLTTTNRLANLMTQNTVTADSSNGGSVTTGNSFVNGHFGAAFVYVANTLIGGNVSSNGVLKIQANLAITNGSSNVLIVTANSTTSNVRITSDNITFLPTGNVNLGGNTFVVNTANVLFSGSNIQFTNSPLSGNLTFNSNTTYNGSAIIANGSFGANGSVLYSNGTGMYWNQIPNVVGNTGIIANASGIFVNSAYIATIAANSATGSLTNTFTVGTAAYFVANGFVGIGIANPAYALDISGTSTLGAGLRVRDSDGGQAQIILQEGANSGQIAENAGFFYFTNYANGGIIISQATPAPIQMYTNNALRMQITAGGNIGIGNSAPVHRLRVNGDISLSGGIHANGAFGTANQALLSNGTVSYWGNVFSSADVASNTDIRAGTANRIVDSAVLYSGAAPVTLTDGATITADFNTGRVFTVTLGGNRTLANPTNQVAGQSGMVIVSQDGTGSRTLSYGTAWDFPGGAPTLTTTISAKDVISYYVQSSNVIICTISKAFA